MLLYVSCIYAVSCIYRLTLDGDTVTVRSTISSNDGADLTQRIQTLFFADESFVSDFVVVESVTFAVTEAGKLTMFTMFVYMYVI